MSSGGSKKWKCAKKMWRKKIKLASETGNNITSNDYIYWLKVYTLYRFLKSYFSEIFKLKENLKKKI